MSDKNPVGEESKTMLKGANLRLICGENAKEYA
jgi:hypothetical protein